MKVTVATPSFWISWTRNSRLSWARCRPISAVGCARRSCCVSRPRTPLVVVGGRSIRVWARKIPACEVQDLVRYSPVFQRQKWQRFHIKESDKGPVVWEVKWARFYRQTADGLPSEPGCLIVARNVLNPDEVKYFVANQVPTTGEETTDEDKPVTLIWLLWVAFRRWPVEQCFRESKNELGMDHYEVRGWRCIHRHYYITQLSHLFCARIRQEYAATSQLGRLTVEQVRRAVNTWLSTADLPPAARQRRLEQEQNTLRYYQRRAEQARKSHTKTRLKELAALGIDMNGSAFLHSGWSFLTSPSPHPPRP